MADSVTPHTKKKRKRKPETIFYKVVRKANSEMNAERGKPHQAAIARIAHNFTDDEQCRHVTSELRRIRHSPGTMA